MLTSFVFELNKIHALGVQAVVGAAVGMQEKLGEVRDFQSLVSVFKSTSAANFANIFFNPRTNTTLATEDMREHAMWPEEEVDAEERAESDEEHEDEGEEKEKEPVSMKRVISGSLLSLAKRNNVAVFLAGKKGFSHASTAGEGSDLSFVEKRQQHYVKQ